VATASQRDAYSAPLDDTGFINGQQVNVNGGLCV
jgi:hypothetical protein